MTTETEPIKDIYRLAVFVGDTNHKVYMLEKFRHIVVCATYQEKLYRSTFHYDAFLSGGGIIYFCIRSNVPENVFVLAIQRAFKASKIKMSGELSKIINPSLLTSRKPGQAIKQPVAPSETKEEQTQEPSPNLE